MKLHWLWAKGSWIQTYWLVLVSCSVNLLFIYQNISKNMIKLSNIIRKSNLKLLKHLIKHAILLGNSKKLVQLKVLKSEFILYEQIETFMRRLFLIDVFTDYFFGLAKAWICRHSFLPWKVYETEVAILMNHAPTLDRIELLRFDIPRLKRAKRDRLICRFI